MAALSLRRAPADLEALAPALRSPPEELADLRRSLARPPGPVAWFATACLLLIPFWLAQFEASIWSKALRGSAGPLPWITLCPLSLLHWVAGAYAAGVLVHTTAVFYGLGRRSVEVDVFRLDAMEPFGRVGSRNGLFVLGLFAIFPLMWIARPVAVADFSAFPFVFALAVVGAVFPMRGAQLATRHTKQGKLAALDLEIARVSDAKPEDTLRFGRLADLLTIREAVLASREWPLSSGVLERLLLYFALPLLSWVCGALVEQYVDQLLAVLGTGS